MTTKRITLPPGLGLSGSGKVQWEKRGQMNVQSAGKPPKRRFSPGQFVWVENKMWEIICAYRLAHNPSEWLYCLEERQGLRTTEPDDPRGQALVAIGAGSQTPRVVYELFHSESQAHTYFADIPSNGSQKVFTNKMLLQRKAEVRSSGEVLDPTEVAKRK